VKLLLNVNVLKLAKRTDTNFKENNIIKEMAKHYKFFFQTLLIICLTYYIFRVQEIPHASIANLSYIVAE